MDLTTESSIIIPYPHLNLLLDVPQDAAFEDEGIQFEATAIDIENAPPIPCEVGETILSAIVKIQPLNAIKKKKPITLLFEHGIAEIPELSSMVIMYYNNVRKEWEKLPSDSGGSNKLLCTYFFHNATLFPEIILNLQTLADMN